MDEFPLGHLGDLLERIHIDISIDCIATGIEEGFTFAIDDVGEDGTREGAESDDRERYILVSEGFCSDERVEAEIGATIGDEDDMFFLYAIREKGGCLDECVSDIGSGGIFFALVDRIGRSRLDEVADSLTIGRERREDEGLAREDDESTCGEIWDFFYKE